MIGLAITLLVIFPAPSPAQAQKKVLLIGIDGAGGRYVQQANTPHLDALASAGMARYDALNEGALFTNPPEPYGASGVNWSTILTGVSAAKHGVSDNSFAGSNFEDHPHFFQHVKQHDANLQTISLSNWSPINTFITPNQYADIEIGYDAGSVETQDLAVKNDAVAFLLNGRRFGDSVSAPVDPDAMFLHFDQVDHAGHSYSWGSPQHLASIEQVDALIGGIVSAVSLRSGVQAGTEDWLIMVTADHGAAPGSFGHVASQGPPNWEVPFILQSPSLAPGTPIQQPTLRDLASTALWHLGIDPFEAGLDGAVRGLSVTPPNGVVGDLNGDGLVFGNGQGIAAEDDVTTFLNGWRQEGGGSISQRYARGDINLDGVTDLADWALINELNPALGATIGRALAGIPEPSSFLLLVLSTLAIAIGSRYID